MTRLSRIYTVLFHVSLWAVLILCIFLWAPRNTPPRGSVTSLQITCSGLTFVAIFYVHAYWLMPCYLFRKRILLYILSLMAAWLIMAALPALVYFMVAHPAGRPYPEPLMRRIFAGLFFLMASASLGAFRENFRLEKKRKEKETEHLRTELSFLRAQVNPHFMLNVLNSMVLLASRKSDLLEPVLMELAGLMNYMLYDANNEKISLEDEIKYLRAYVDLQLLRFGDDVDVRFNTSEVVESKYIEPMLLIPLVENAFKHGIGLVENPEIGIDIRAADGDRLCMTVKNKYNPLLGQGDQRPPGTTRPKVIFITAYRNYAVEGFDLDVLDYLIKPVAFDRFLRAAAKALEYQGFKQRDTALASHFPDYLFVHTEYQLTKIFFHEITYIESLRNYLKIYRVGSSKAILSKFSMKAMEEKLPTGKYARVHKSFIVMLDKINTVRNDSIRIGDAEIPVSWSYRDEFFQKINT